MSTPTNPSPAGAPHPLDAKAAAWVELRDELSHLHAKLEYLALMLRIERNPPPG